MRPTRIGENSQLLKYLIAICTFLACITPRYISTFKINIGMSISFFTVFVFLTWFLCSRRIRIYRSIYSYFFLIWLFLVLISFIYSKSIGDWLYYFVWIITAFFYMQLLYTSFGRWSYDYIIYAIVFALLIHLMIGLYEVAFHQHLFHTGNYGVKYYGTTPIGIFHNPNDYATFIATTMPFTAYLYQKSEKKIVRIFCVAACVLSLIMLVLSKSRMAFFTIIAGLFVIMYLYYKKSNYNKFRFFISSIPIIVIVLVSSRIQEIIFKQLEINSINLENSGDMNRINLIKNGLYFLKETYGLGIGAGNMKYWLSNRSIYYIGRLLYIHNWYLELLVTFGVVFFILYLILHCKIFLTLSKLSINEGKILNLNSALLISFTMFSVISISSSSNAYSEWVWMYYGFVSSYVLFMEFYGRREYKGITSF